MIISDLLLLTDVSLHWTQSDAFTINYALWRAVHADVYCWEGGSPSHPIPNAMITSENINNKFIAC